MDEGDALARVRRLGELATSSSTASGERRSKKRKAHVVDAASAVGEAAEVEGEAALDGSSSDRAGATCRSDLSQLARLISEPVEQAAKPVRDRGSIRKNRPCYRYGNYLTYYGYRVGAEMEDDPRLKLFQAEWFHGKRMVDIGCNAGLVTLRACSRFLCASVVGVDIDRTLVQKAVRALCTARDQVANWHKTGTCEPAVVQSWSGAHVHATWTPAAALQSLRKVTFTHANFVEDTHECKAASADTVMCLSVSKWIHINWGDKGLRQLFDKVFRVLAPGGVFILEPQPWKSYQQAFNKQDMPAELKHVLPTLELRPDQFAHILLTEVGFAHVEPLGTPVGVAGGFGRPLLLCRKALG